MIRIRGRVRNKVSVMSDKRPFFSDHRTITQKVLWVHKYPKDSSLNKGDSDHSKELQLFSIILVDKSLHKIVTQSFCCKVL